VVYPGSFSGLEFENASFHPALMDTAIEDGGGYRNRTDDKSFAVFHTCCRMFPGVRRCSITGSSGFTMTKKWNTVKCRKTPTNTEEQVYPRGVSRRCFEAYRGAIGGNAPNASTTIPSAVIQLNQALDEYLHGSGERQERLRLQKGCFPKFTGTYSSFSYALFHRPR